MFFQKLFNKSYSPQTFKWECIIVHIYIDFFVPNPLSNPIFSLHKAHSYFEKNDSTKTYAFSHISDHTAPKSSSLPEVSFPRVVGADVAVVLVPNAGLTQVPWVVSFRIMFCVLHSWDTAVAKEISYRWKP